MKLTEEFKQELSANIQESLENATLIFLKDEDGNDYPLIDHLSNMTTDVSSGKEEIKNIVEQVYYDMDNWNVEAYINIWNSFDKTLPNYGDVIVVQYPPEQRDMPFVVIYDGDLEWFYDSKWMLLYPSKK